MNKLKIEDFDQEKLKKKNLVVNGELSEKFYNVYKIYYNRLIKYILFRVSLYQCNKNIITLGLPIIKKENNVSFNQELSPFKFTYIDNVLHIERLTPQIIDFLNDVYVKNLGVSRSDWDSFIQQTYREVVREKDDCKIKIGIVYDLDFVRFRLPTDIGENIDDLFNKHKAAVDAVCQEIVTEAEKLDIPLAINNYGYDENVIQAIKESVKEYDNNKSM